MNSLILQATAITNPESRQTPDNSNTIASFLIQFPAPKQEDPPFRIKCTAWNKLADRVMSEIKNGSQLIIEGRLRIDTVDRGTHKEKRTELVASTFYAIATTSPAPQPLPTTYAQSVPVAPIAPQVIHQQTQDYDDIPY